MRLLFHLLLAASACLRLDAQAVSGTIYGTVRDESGAAVAGAKLSVRNVDTNYARTLESDAEGGFRFASMPLGGYTLVVEHPGFSQLTQEGITLQVDQQARVDVTLRVGNVAEKLVVTAEAPLVNAANAETAEVIDRRRVEHLPLNGRNFVQLIQLTTGTNTGASGDTQNNLVINHFRGSAFFSANGMRTWYNNYVLDGVDNNESAWNSGGIVLLPVIDAIKEFKVATGNFSSEFGRAAGGVVNVQTRSGTNELHGTLFQFFRNSALDANDFFNNSNGRPNPAFRQNQFGATLGGPLVRNRWFFFADYQGMRQRRELTYLASVPPAAARSGDFTNTRFGAIFDPLTSRTAAGATTRDAFPDRRIPSSRIDATAARYLEFFPASNTADAQAIALNFINNPKWIRGGNQGDIRIDGSVGTRLSMFGRYSADKAFQFFPNDLATPSNPFGGGGRANNLDLSVQGFAYNATYLAKPTVVLEGRLGFNRYNFAGLPLGFGAPEADKLTLPGARIGPLAQSSSSMNVTGFTAFGPTTGLPNFSVMNMFQYVFNTTWTRGRHNMKTGVDFRRYRRNNHFVSAQQTGSFNFSPGLTSQNGLTGGVGLATYLLGYPDRIQRGYIAGGVGRRNWEFSYYAQDEFKVTERLNLSFGIRYDLFTPIVEVHDRMTILDLVTGKVIAPQQGGPLGRGLRRTDRNNIAPRAGFAWRAPGRSGLIVRGGYGISYIEEFGGNGTNPIQNLPNAFTQDIAYSTTGTPQAALSSGVPLPGAIDLANPFGQFRMISPDAVAAYAQSWDFSLQREWGSQWMADASYVGAKGTNLLEITDPNQPVPGAGAINPRRPLFAVAPNVTTSVGRSVGNSIYHSFQAKLQKRFASGFYFLGSYTLAKSIGSPDSNFSNATPGVSNLGQAQNPLNRAADRGLIDSDVPQRLVMSYGWELPWLKRSKLGGWQISGITTLSSGNPFDLFMGTSTLNTGTTQRPDRIADGRLDGVNLDRYFDLAAFRAPAAFVYGNSGRNILRGPGLKTWDVSVLKDTHFSERWNLQWRTDFFNAANTPQFNPPGNTIGTAQAGRISSTRFATNRQIQFAVKLFF